MAKKKEYQVVLKGLDALESQIKMGKEQVYALYIAFAHLIDTIDKLDLAYRKNINAVKGDLGALKELTKTLDNTNSAEKLLMQTEASPDQLRMYLVLQKTTLASQELSDSIDVLRGKYTDLEKITSGIQDLKNSVSDLSDVGSDTNNSFIDFLEKSIPFLGRHKKLIDGIVDGIKIVKDAKDTYDDVKDLVKIVKSATGAGAGAAAGAEGATAAGLEAGEVVASGIETAEVATLGAEGLGLAAGLEGVGAVLATAGAVLTAPVTLTVLGVGALGYGVYKAVQAHQEAEDEAAKKEAAAKKKEEEEEIKFMEGATHGMGKETKSYAINNERRKLNLKISADQKLIEVEKGRLKNAIHHPEERKMLEEFITRSQSDINNQQAKLRGLDAFIKNPVKPNKPTASIGKIGSKADTVTSTSQSMTYAKNKPLDKGDHTIQSSRADKVTGGKQVTINVQINKLVELIKIEAANIKQGANSASEDVGKALLAAVHQFSASADI